MEMWGGGQFRLLKGEHRQWEEWRGLQKNVGAVLFLTEHPPGSGHGCKLFQSTPSSTFFTSLWQTGFGFAQREEGEQMLQTIINYEQMDKEQELELQEEMMKYKRPFFPQQAHFLLQ